MKEFFKMLLATIVGVLVVNVLGLFIIISVIGTLALMQGKPVIVKENSILKLELDRILVDRASEDPLSNFNYLAMQPKKEIGLNAILKSIDHAKNDINISGIYMDLSEIQGNFGALASIEEIRDALNSFKESGKFVYSYSNLGYSQKSYFLATIADKVYVNPETPLMLQGMSSSISFYKNMLAKLGVTPEIVKVGKFKSAVEPFISDKMSDANREQVQRYLNSSWATLVDGIAQSRNMTSEKINAITNDFRIYPTSESVELGLFDKTMYEDEMLQLLAEEVGVSNPEDIHFISVNDYQKSIIPVSHKNEIAIVYAQGEIGMEQADNAIGPELAQTIRKIRMDDDIKAVVLRVNSPGGSALTSEIIWREVELTTHKKPVVVSMGNVAASGGYYISCAANRIFADSTTLTGSIGIFGMFFSGEDLIKNKMGINTDVVKTNEHSDFGGSYPLPIPISARPLTEYEHNVLQQFVNRGYETFLSRVMQGRDMRRSQLDSIAQGRVWTGKDALSIGLVDELGGLDAAVATAAKLASIDTYSITEYPKLKNTFEELFTEFTSEIQGRIVERELGEFYITWEKMKQMIANEGLVARIPFDLAL